jgi:hypothetical protein
MIQRSLVYQWVAYQPPSLSNPFIMTLEKGNNLVKTAHQAVATPRNQKQRRRYPVSRNFKVSESVILHRISFVILALTLRHSIKNKTARLHKKCKILSAVIKL